MNMPKDSLTKRYDVFGTARLFKYIKGALVTLAGVGAWTAGSYMSGPNPSKTENERPEPKEYIAIGGSSPAVYANMTSNGSVEEAPIGNSINFGPFYGHDARLFAEEKGVELNVMPYSILDGDPIDIHIPLSEREIIEYIGNVTEKNITGNVEIIWDGINSPMLKVGNQSHNITEEQAVEILGYTFDGNPADTDHIPYIEHWKNKVMDRAYTDISGKLDEFSQTLKNVKDAWEQDNNTDESTIANLTEQLNNATQKYQSLYQQYNNTRYNLTQVNDNLTAQLSELQAQIDNLTAELYNYTHAYEKHVLSPATFLDRLLNLDTRRQFLSDEDLVNLFDGNKSNGELVNATIEVPKYNPDLGYKLVLYIERSDEIIVKSEQEITEDNAEYLING